MKPAMTCAPDVRPSDEPSREPSILELLSQRAQTLVPLTPALSQREREKIDGATAEEQLATGTV